MQNEIDEAISKLSELSIEKRKFVLDFINEAHRQDNQQNKEERQARHISNPDDRVKFYTNTGTVYKDKKGRVLHRGDRVKVETSGSIRGIKINKGSLGYVIDSEVSSGYAIVLVDKLIGHSKETIKRQPQNLTILN